MTRLNNDELMERLKYATEVINLVESTPIHCTHDDPNCPGCLATQLGKAVTLSAMYISNTHDPDAQEVSFGTVAAILGMMEFPQAIHAMTEVMRETPEFLIGLELGRRYMERKSDSEHS